MRYLRYFALVGIIGIFSFAGASHLFAAPASLAGRRGSRRWNPCSGGRRWPRCRDWLAWRSLLGWTPLLGSSRLYAAHPAGQVDGAPVGTIAAKNRRSS
jgi:hypothetical protein